MRIFPLWITIIILLTLGAPSSWLRDYVFPSVVVVIYTLGNWGSSKNSRFDLLTFQSYTYRLNLNVGCSAQLRKSLVKHLKSECTNTVAESLSACWLAPSFRLYITLFFLPPQVTISFYTLSSAKSWLGGCFLNCGYNFVKLRVLLGNFGGQWVRQCWDKLEATS